MASREAGSINFQEKEFLVRKKLRKASAGENRAPPKTAIPRENASGDCPLAPIPETKKKSLSTRGTIFSSERNSTARISKKGRAGRLVRKKAWVRKAGASSITENRARASPRPGMIPSIKGYTTSSTGDGWISSDENKKIGHESREKKSPALGRSRNGKARRRVKGTAPVVFDQKKATMIERIEHVFCSAASDEESRKRAWPNGKQAQCPPKQDDYAGLWSTLKPADC